MTFHFSEPCPEFELTSDIAQYGLNDLRDIGLNVSLSNALGQYGLGGLQEVEFKLSLGRYALQEERYNGRPVYHMMLM